MFESSSRLMFALLEKKLIGFGQKKFSIFYKLLFFYLKKTLKMLFSQTFKTKNINAHSVISKNINKVLWSEVGRKNHRLKNSTTTRNTFL